MEIVFETDYSLSEAESVAHRIFPWIQSKKRVLFKGEIGAGKTTLIQYLANLMGVEEVVDSPTFSLVNEYLGTATIYHFDLYRIKSAEELWDIGWEEYLENNDHIWVEWPERVPEAFNDDFLLVEIGALESLDVRKIKVIALN